ncbi:helix-turn-helix transcriptional regulator [Sinomonas sp. JGH33]|uniref:Helix-turn-helix transcriptional regulator n=1 Tax=Sinomonas terricola TaxID=3110330 RepID=A0ABU5T1S3_9MICC|nr:helix-turn-helix transcriptional regulator [Sinomonas sp. JGH33]MEA5453593.1 helix-turn-helix transcriptional regulator [Sinomonas sp. JGH33]
MEEKSLNDGPLGENLKNFRDNAGLTQAELAERLTLHGIPGMYSQTIAKIEGGKRTLKFEEGVRVAEILHIDPQWLLGPGDPAALQVVVAERELNAYKKSRDEAIDRLEALIERRQDLLPWIDDWLSDASSDDPAMAEWLEKVRVRVDEELRMPVSDDMRELLPDLERLIGERQKPKRGRNRK